MSSLVVSLAIWVSILLYLVGVLGSGLPAPLSSFLALKKRKNGRKTALQCPLSAYISATRDPRAAIVRATEMATAKATASGNGNGFVVQICCKLVLFFTRHHKFHV